MQEIMLPERAILAKVGVALVEALVLRLAQALFASAFNRPAVA